MSAGEVAKLTHIEARKLWGVPDSSEGSVNDPRTIEEHGVRFNEKWIYLLDSGGKRLVYWHRYDCRGLLIELPDGSTKDGSL